jgi:Holliday junction resolvasome RuvABC DNA-binding subunit
VRALHALGMPRAEARQKVLGIALDEDLTAEEYVRRVLQK